LAARSAAEFIEDPKILEYVRQLQSQPVASLSATVESEDAWAALPMH